MKVELEANSVQMRLTEAEVRSLAETGRVESHTLLSASDQWNRIAYAVEHSHQYQTISVDHIGFELRITVPSREVMDWLNGDISGVYGEETMLGRVPLAITLRRDPV